MKEIKVMDTTYEIIIDEENVFDEELFLSKYTDYFLIYDYVVGDYAYSRMRLKGFFDDSNPKKSNINNYKYLDKYLKDHCAFGCKYFVLKKK